jgi:hypothetical protein
MPPLTTEQKAAFKLLKRQKLTNMKKHSALDAKELAALDKIKKLYAAKHAAVDNTTTHQQNAALAAGLPIPAIMVMNEQIATK